MNTLPLLLTCLALAPQAPALEAPKAAPAGIQYRIPPLLEDPAQQAALVVPESGSVPLTLTRSGEGTELLDLSLSSFTDERGNPVEVKIAIPDYQRPAAARQSQVEIDRAIVPLRLEASGLPTLGKFAGYLFLSRGRTLLKTYSLALTRVKLSSAAKLVLDQQALTLPLTRSWFWGQDGPAFTVHVREEAGEWPLTGLFVRLQEMQTSGPPLDPAQCLAFTLNGHKIANLWSWPPAGQNPEQEKQRRTVAAGQQAAVHGQFSDLPPGDYTVKLRFTAVNSQPDDRQLLTLRVKVRDFWGWAVLCLLGAIAVSFVATKGLKTRRDRLQLRQRILDLRPAWLAGEPLILSVVWLKAMLRQAEDLSRRFLLVGTETTDARLQEVSQLLKPGGLLERIHNVRQSIPRLDGGPMVKRRAEKMLRSIAARLPTGPLDEKLSTRIEAELAALEAWSELDKLKTGYWSDLKKDIDELLPTVRVEAVPESRRNTVRDLSGRLAKAAASTDPHTTHLRDIEAFEDQYAALKIIWERREQPEFVELVQKQGAGEPISTLFEIADRSAWKRLKDRRPRLLLPRRAAPEPFEAYQPLLFQVEAVHPEDRDTYLFNYGLRYEWTLEVKRRKIVLKKKKWFRRRELRPITEEPLTPITNEPRVVQYAPGAGQLTASVTIRFGNETIEVPSEGELRIKKSSVFGLQKAFQWIEAAALAVAALLAVATGLSTFYLDNATFGSLKDYVSLFLWGAAADQLKNLAQPQAGPASAAAAKKAAGG